MDEDSTTGAANDQTTDATQGATGADSQATTDTQTGENADNLATSDSTEKSGDADAKADNKGDDTSASKFDDDLDQWAEKTGRPKPSTDAERQAYQDLRDSQREFTRQRQGKDEASKLDKTIKDAKTDLKSEDDSIDDPFVKRVSDLEESLAQERAMRQRSEYFADNNVSNEEAATMGEILKEKIDRAGTPEAKLKALEFWTDPANLADWHTLAQARLAKGNGDAVAQAAAEAAQKERERLAKVTASDAPNRSASKIDPAKKTEEQARLERFSNWD